MTAVPRRLLALATAAAAATLATACSDFANPSELTKPTVLAVIADPPLVAPGAATSLSVVMAGPDGPLDPSAVQWQLIETLPGVAPIGTLTADGVTATYQAPEQLPELPDGSPPLDSVQATITAGDTSVVVVKGVLIADLPSANPAVTALMVDGDAADDGLTIDAGATYPLELATDPAPGDDATFAWYSTVGEIALYQSNPTELVAGDAGDGWLFVVMRDGRGGVAWRGVSVEVR
ncbi:MAG: hypothetical protein H6709_01300 [Kofleriaceae bacterium]|nr:hypothetical protein [Myxococcales bacterium]MCB9570705.1 hypothetical protein [Kofleriaceae bacterium]